MSAKKRIDAGKATAVADEVTRLLSRARSLGYAPLIAEAEFAAGLREEARRTFERGLAIVDDAAEDEGRGALRFGLARARWALDEQDAEAIELARQAERELARDEAASSDARAWLAERERERELELEATRVESRGPPRARPSE